MHANTRMTLWAAFCVSQLMFGAVSLYTWPGAQPENALTIWVIASMIAPMTLLSVFGAGLLARGRDAATTAQLLRWAFAESIAVFGVVCSFLGGPIWLGPAMAGWGFLLVLIAFPKQEA